ncbi:hypothetical protein [Actinokineospora sp. NBRC 105648]|uniref:hypothetical protein n=1 Tax=Actinokineospora sp. NBRC 105648 TaxID=3032206 RepID=UPI002555B6C0|nr:hypothetical protein [Actinokineospora sp. NBRC 105648]
MTRLATVRSELAHARDNSVRILGELDSARRVEAVARQIDRDLDAAAAALAHGAMR